MRAPPSRYDEADQSAASILGVCVFCFLVCHLCAAMLISQTCRKPAAAVSGHRNRMVVPSRCAAAAASAADIARIVTTPRIMIAHRVSLFARVPTKRAESRNRQAERVQHLGNGRGHESQNECHFGTPSPLGTNLYGQGNALYRRRMHVPSSPRS